MKRALLLATLMLGTAQAERVYRVKAGDTLWSVAQSHGTTVRSVQALNGMANATIRVGEVLRLPGRAVTSPDEIPATPPAASAVFQRGQAVYYGGRRDQRTPMTAAHLTLPFGTWVRVTHARTGRSVNVMINDRGPFGVRSRVIDLSTDAARMLGMLSEGVAPVTLTVMSRP